VRKLTALALVLAACGPADRPGPPAAHDAPSANGTRGPDLLVMRLPRGGGPVQVFAYPSLDSVVWTSGAPGPALDHILAFDDDGGVLAYLDAKGLPGRVDFRLDDIATASKAKLTDVSSIDGSTIYGLTRDGSVLRLTPSGDWTFKPPRAARTVLPLSDGSVLVIASRADSAVLWKLFPPETKLRDTARLPDVEKSPFARAGDRLYFAVGRELIGVQMRDLAPLPAIELDHPARALVATPSGDRLYVISDSSNEISIIDRYRERVSGQVVLPAKPTAMRIDPLGRYLLVRGEAADSLWVVAIASDRLVGALHSTWRVDLPYVAPDGAIAVADGADVVFVDGETLRERKRVRNGAKDFWYSFSWTGFRPRAAALDQPVSFPADTIDSISRAFADTARPVVTAPPRDTTPRAAPPAPKGWIVSFAALLSDQKARELAAQIHVGSETPRVVPSSVDGQVIYRVVLGPYPTRDDAERVGRDSRQKYWVYEAAP
jgi:hypothetical protein